MWKLLAIPVSVFRLFVTQSLRRLVCSSGKGKCAVDSMYAREGSLTKCSMPSEWRCRDVLLLEVDAQNDLGNLNQPDFKVNF